MVTLWSFAEMCRAEKKVSPTSAFQLRQGDTAFLFSSLTVNNRPVHGLLTATSFAFGGFLLVLSQFRMALSEVLKCCLLFLNARSLCASQSTLNYHSSMSYRLWAMSSMLMNQQHMLNKASLHRNTHKTRFLLTG